MWYQRSGRMPLILLYAQPQVGKTGTALWLLKLLDQKYSMTCNTSSSGFSTQQATSFVKLNKELYNANPNDLVGLIRDNGSKYHDLYRKNRVTWSFTTGRYECEMSPANMYSTMITEQVEAAFKAGRLRKDDVVRVADLGCGDCDIAYGLKSWRAQTGERYPEIRCDNYDIKKWKIDSDIEVIEGDIRDANTFKDRTGSYDFVILCLALFGKDYAQTMCNAWNILKEKRGKRSDVLGEYGGMHVLELTRCRKDLESQMRYTLDVNGIPGECHGVTVEFDSGHPYACYQKVKDQKRVTRLLVSKDGASQLSADKWISD
eukprot:GFYU01026141.1.p1 GENE.GFYU01026141.1~~GFYU01026141.1.p1  ORF type:complete len:345 (-),score=43.81 GFYU01026141.1:98-1048(-)